MASEKDWITSAKMAWSMVGTINPTVALRRPCIDWAARLRI
jgi:hypothetical protein